ncbi:MBL fold metallo-hydrolase [Allosediminivita pacifica]|uniref:Glyoxylase-like metal-dependent hydrolase (Beta-lactamase superfamily II) n=1 Tax=Allosediminivita pacifica TaxID=1267769 RepID=A0A2T6AW12_9RHOB|nr:MBL fold metallo-hydrolase [Allosediminivita pacifica]PTX48004.1 glyoxylase-like metal-dependent hydrolase (beta-lactamase superfamily II) [Allosediminivita pacifica]
MTDPQPDFRPSPLIPERIAPGLRRILAPNASPMTYRGTNTYLLGTSDIAVIDPGPDDPSQQAAILGALEPSQRISTILVTHAHLDHSPLARRLSEATGAPVLAFGDAESGRAPDMARLADAATVGGGEGVDISFRPDRTLGEGESLEGDGWRLTAMHLPGHFGNHMGFAWGDALFSGDLVMGWATSLVSPPDGDLTAFMASLRRLQAHRWSVFYPAHGAPVTSPGDRLAELVAHREAREAAILAALESGPASAIGLATRIYTETPAPLLSAARRNVLAHLIDLQRRSCVGIDEPLSEASVAWLT